MTLSRFFVVLFMLVAVRLSNGVTNAEECVEPAKSSLPTKVCINKTPKHDSYLDDMTEELIKNGGLKSFKQDPLEDFEPIVTGDGMDNCMTRTTIEMPYMIKDNTSSLHYVVQLKDFEQRIKVTRCEAINESCLGSMYSKDNENSVQTACREKQGLVSVYVYDPNVRKLVYKSFDLPVCCACMKRNLH